MPDKRDSVIFNLNEVLEMEKEFIRQRRLKLENGESPEEMDDLFGLAMSGGGIRSAILNLGFTRFLNEHGLFKKVDYLSTVSGGGYTGSYLQVTLKNAPELKEEADREADMMENTYFNLGENPPEFKEIFRRSRIDHLKDHGNYMTPGSGWQVRWNQLVLIVSYLSSLLHSWVGPFIAIAIMYFFVNWAGGYFNDGFGTRELSDPNMEEIRQNVSFWLFRCTWAGFIALFGFHFLANISGNYHLDISLAFNKAKSLFIFVVLGLIFLSALVFYFSGFDISQFDFDQTTLISLCIVIALLILGVVANPNSLSLHRLYRKRLADAFLDSGGIHKNIKLHQLANPDGERPDYAAPYPLINTCLNLQAGKTDDSFQGAKSNDYFLLSPYFCGSKLTGYLSTRENPFYKRMTLPTAMAISAAAVNPGMGNYSNPILSVLTTVFNLRLGFWTLNPKRIAVAEDTENVDMTLIREELQDPEVLERYQMLKHCEDLGEISLEEELELKALKKKMELLEYYGTNPIKRPFLKFVWWPKYFFYELFSGINTKHRMINISDGGHIENLAVYELLRRRCKLIICFDGGADPKYTYPDLQNLVVRARNELAIELRWRDDQIPEEVITAIPSNGFSRTHFAIADILELTEEKNVKGKIGVFVYVKSSVTAPSRKKDVSLQSDSFKYKTYHPDFPHESTADQFFDHAQWEAHYDLGYYIAQDVMLGRVPKKDAKVPGTIQELYEHFDNYEHKDPEYFLNKRSKKEFMEVEEFIDYKNEK